MTRREYMARFSLAARWFLPQAEAAETAADYMEVYLGGASGGPSRKYYRLTEAGRVRRGELLRQWHELREAMESLIGTK